MKRFVAVVGVLAMAAIAVTVVGAQGVKEGEEMSGHYRSTRFEGTKDYYGWGPACHFERSVRIVYEAANRWTYIVKDGSVRGSMIQVGTARIYAEDAKGEFTVFLKSKPFEVTERFADRGSDVAIRHDGEYTCYLVSHNWTSPALEVYEYNWEIDGVFELSCRNKGGAWRFRWRSGDCEGGQRDGWPPLPPYPHTRLIK